MIVQENPSFPNISQRILKTVSQLPVIDKVLQAKLDEEEKVMIANYYKSH
jgi:hypothetical protein